MTLERKSRSEDDPTRAAPSRTQHFGQDEIPGAAPANSSKPASDLVQTRWLVDYESVGGKSTKLPDRYGDDQMIVDELKIRPNNGASEKLRGGNMATSGDVVLGTAAIAKGEGRVSAAVRYAKKRSFDVKLTLHPAGTAAERKLLADTRKEIRALALEMVQDRGDYKGIASELQTQFADRFPDKTLTIELDPLARGQASTLYAADGAEYTADKDSTFAVLVEPGAQRSDSTAYSRTEGGEVGELESDQSSVKSTSDVATRTKEADKAQVIASFKSSLSKRVEQAFKSVEDKAVSATDQTTKIEGEDVKWTVGVDPAKEKKDGEPKPSGGGITDTIKSKLRSVGNWVLRKGKGLAKRFSFLATGLDLIGSLWGGLTARGRISRESTDSDSTSHTKGTGTTDRNAQEVTSLSGIATDMTNSMQSLVEHDVEKEVSARLGTEVSATKKSDASKKSTVSRTVSGTTVTNEVGQPRLTVKKLD